MMKIIESPREGMQGFPCMIPTEEKVRYIDHLLRVGFDTVEVGSLASPGVIPQMADSLDVLKKIDLSGISTNIMFLVLNARGAEMLANAAEITHLSYPFSFSPTFLKLNVNSTVGQSLETAEVVNTLCQKHGKQAVIYISMAFGNPFGDLWSIDLLVDWVGKLYQAGARIISLSNVSMELDAAQISEVYSTLIPMFPEVEFGLHLHTSNQGWHAKVQAAYDAGCRRFDGVINGRGGCPMAGKKMLGNLDTESLIAFAEEKEALGSIDKRALEEARMLARKIFK
jgi:hydroxymethylglutaryl-CoA lyase